MVVKHPFNYSGMAGEFSICKVVELSFDALDARANDVAHLLLCSLTADNEACSVVYDSLKQDAEGARERLLHCVLFRNFPAKMQPTPLANTWIAAHLPHDRYLTLLCCAGTAGEAAFHNSLDGAFAEAGYRHLPATLNRPPTYQVIGTSRGELKPMQRVH